MAGISTIKDPRASGSKAGRGAVPTPMWPASMVRCPWPKRTRPSPWGGTCLGWEKLWETYGKMLGIIRKLYGNMGKTMKHLWDLMGILWDLYRI